MRTDATEKGIKGMLGHNSAPGYPTSHHETTSTARPGALPALVETTPVLSALFLVFMSSVTFFKPFVTVSPYNSNHNEAEAQCGHCWRQPSSA